MVVITRQINQQSQVERLVLRLGSAGGKDAVRKFSAHFQDFGETIQCQRAQLAAFGDYFDVERRQCDELEALLSRCTVLAKEAALERHAFWSPLAQFKNTVIGEEHVSSAPAWKQRLGFVGAELSGLIGALTAVAAAHFLNPRLGVEFVLLWGGFAGASVVELANSAFQWHAETGSMRTMRKLAEALVGSEKSILMNGISPELMDSALETMRKLADSDEIPIAVERCN